MQTEHMVVIGAASELRVRSRASKTGLGPVSSFFY